MAIKIHKGIPAPEPTSSKYPFSDLGIGDMFHVPVTDDPNEDITALTRRVQSATSMRRKRYPGEEYVTQQVMDGDVLGVGVWRTA